MKKLLQNGSVALIVTLAAAVAAYYYGFRRGQVSGMGAAQLYSMYVYRAGLSSLDARTNQLEAVRSTLEAQFVPGICVVSEYLKSGLAPPEDLDYGRQLLHEAVQYFDSHPDRKGAFASWEGLRTLEEYKQREDAQHPPAN